MFDRIASKLLLVLVASLPFEFYRFPVFSNLQWIFALVLIASFPLLIHNWKALVRDRLVRVAAVFVMTQWLTTLFAGEYLMNSAKASIRVSAGFVLLCIICCQQEKAAILRYWSAASIAAAVYGLVDLIGFGYPRWFRDAEFYFADQVRLSGSFEYPTTAAAFYAMSLPIVFVTPAARGIRIAGCLVLWAALILTYSRGAAVAAAIVMFCGFFLFKPKFRLKLAIAGVGIFVVLSVLQPQLIARYGTVRSGKAISARYELDHNIIRQQPRTTDTLRVTVENSGSETWRANGEDQVFLSYHWYDTYEKLILRDSAIETVLPTDVPPDGTVTLTAAFETPVKPGLYLLDWDLNRKDRGWFSTEYEVTPAVVEAHIAENVVPRKDKGDVSKWYLPMAKHIVKIDATVPRSDLWRAAGVLARDSPLIGWGPDNYRFLYGPRLGADAWDTKIRANSLYFELLAGSGLIGLTAFFAMMLAVPWSASAASMGAAVFLLHGVVDVLLMTTPIYFGFWILLGLAHENRV